MSTQTGPVILGRGPGAADDSTASDLQQVVARVLAILGERRWLFTFCLLTGVMLTLTVSLFLPRQYNLSTLFERRDDVVITKLVSANSPYSFETLRRSLTIDLAGYNAILQAVDDLGVGGLPPGTDAAALSPEARSRRQALVSRISRQISVNLMEKSTFLDLIEVKYSGDDPELGVRLMTRLKDNYISRMRQRISEILTKSHEFFGQEAAGRKERVARMEAELLQTLVQHPGVDPADPGVLDQRLMTRGLALEELARRRFETSSRLEGAQEYLRQLDSASALPTTRPAVDAQVFVPNPRRQRIQQEIDRVEAEIADARSLRKMTDNHPTVIGLRQKIERLRGDLEREPEATARVPLPAPLPGDPPSASPLEAERRRVQIEVTSLTDVLAQIGRDEVRHKAEMARLEEEKGKLFERRQTFLIQQQELQSAKSDLNVWEGHVEAISRVLAAEAEARGIQFATMEDARRPAKPNSPTVLGVFLLSAAVGLALAAAAVFLREVFDRSFRDPERVRQSLGVPVLEVIGEIRAGRPVGRMSRRRLLPVLAGAQAALVLGIACVAYASIEKPALYSGLVAWAASVLKT